MITNDNAIHRITIKPISRLGERDVCRLIFAVGSFWVAYVDWVVFSIFIVDPLKKSEKNMDIAKNKTKQTTTTKKHLHHQLLLSGQPKELLWITFFPGPG